MKMYVDGSYNKNTGYYGWAYVGITETGTMQNSGQSSIANSMWQVAGELSATMRAIKDSYDNGIKELDIYYDYKGIGMWAEYKWKAKNDYTRAYIKFIKNYREKGMILRFHKIRSHSGNKYNDIVDNLAKKACGVIC